MSAPPFPHGLRGVIFDCDGVMIDSRAANNVFFNRVLAYFGLPPMTPEQEAYSFMATAGQALRHILPERLHGEIERVTRDEVNYQRDIVPLLRLQPGFREFADDLHARGVRMAIATNRISRGIQTVLDFFALPPYFDPVITASNAAPKPSPEGARRICAAWGFAPADVLFVGDSKHDKDAAQGAGTVFAAFNGGELRGRITAADFDQLRRAVGAALPPLPGAQARSIF
ncbi:HAD family hydrolase [Desulfovibrio sp. ZJ200]|uniref:HAD family hydrolase n=1 Tax=Desulfovibrio sp. ZJ200 TaxID=2709792 RepID=UPI0013EA6D86|nr:HAD family hydrolase [Desulfovibrio sp. ZJ200]